MFTPEYQGKSPLEDSEGQKNSENVLDDQAPKTGKDGNKINVTHAMLMDLISFYFIFYHVYIEA